MLLLKVWDVNNVFEILNKILKPVTDKTSWGLPYFSKFSVWPAWSLSFETPEIHRTPRFNTVNLVMLHVPEPVKPNSQQHYLQI
jgi:hypothetical protein